MDTGSHIRQPGFVMNVILANSLTTSSTVDSTDKHSKIVFLEREKLPQKSEFNPFNRLTFKGEKTINNNECNEKENPNVKNEMKNSK